jgi:hypothetical protein
VGWYKELKMASSDEERESFDKLIALLEETCDEATQILGSYTKPTTPYSVIGHEPLENAFHVYDTLGDLLQAARAGRAKLG